MKIGFLFAFQVTLLIILTFSLFTVIHMIHVKICCIKSIEEAEMAVNAGANAIGLVGHMPSGPGVIADETISKISARMNQKTDTFLLTSELSAEGIIAHARRTSTSTIQIVDSVSIDVLKQVKDELPNVNVTQVIHVVDERKMEEALLLNTYVDRFLLDSGNPNLAVKELGGTGRTHNWDISRQIVKEVSVPVFLAGGLNQNNVRDAIDLVNPFGIDLCSSVRENGNLNHVLLQNFMKEVRQE